jgi:hypothetical protein
MSGSRPSVGIRISAEGADKARRDLEQLGTAGDAAMRRVGTATAAAAPQMQNLAKASDMAARSLAGMGGPLGSFTNSLSGASAAAGGLSVALFAIGAAAATGLSAAIQVAEKFERLSLRTEAIVRATGGAAGVSAAEIRTLSQEIARSTLASTESVEAAAGKLLTFRNVAGQTFERTLKAAQDLAAVGFGSIESASVQLGKALENPAEGLSALTRIGVSFSGAQKQVIEQLVATGRAAEAQAVILEAVEKQVGGAGRAEAGGLAGAYDSLSQNVQEFLLIVGNTGPLQAATSAINVLAGAIGALNKAVAPETALAVAERGSAVATEQAARLRTRMQAAESDVRMYMSSGLTREQAISLAAPTAPGDMSGGLAKQLAEAERLVVEANQRLFEARQEHVDRMMRADEVARAAALERDRDAAAEAFKQLRLKHDRVFAAERAHEQEIASINEARRTRVIGEAEQKEMMAAADRRLAEVRAREASGGARVAASLSAEADKRQTVITKLAEQVKAAEGALAMTTAGEAAAREMAIALQIESEIRAAGIPVVEQRTEADRKAAEQIGVNVRRLNELKDAAKKADDEIRKAKAWQEKSWNDLGSIGERAMDRIGDAAVNALLAGEGRAVNFGNVMRGVAMSIAADFAKLALINPFLNWAMPGSTPRSTLSAAMGGGGGGIGDLLGFGQMFGGESIGSMLGLTGAGGLFGATAIGGVGPATSAALAGMGGAFGPASPAQLQATGLFGFGGSGATFGSLLGGAGAGFGAGMFLNSLLGGNQTSGMIGSGGGALAGAVIGSIVPGIGTLLGGLLGGGLGGGLGGLIGPGQSSRGFSYDVRAEGGMLAPLDYRYFNEQGRAQFQEAEAGIAALNALIQQAGLTVSGGRAVGGNRFGMGTLGYGEASSFNEAVGSLQFGATNDPQLNAALSGRSFAGAQALAEFVEGFLAIEAVIKGLTSDAVPGFTASINAVNDNFAAVRLEATRLGASMEGLAEAQSRAIAELESARTEQLRASSAALQIRLLRATGMGQDAELLAQAEAASAEISAFGRALDALAITAEDRAARLVQLEEVQGAERAAILARYEARAVAEFQAIEAAIKKLTADAVPAFTASINAVNDNFAAVRLEATRLGASLEGLTEAQSRAIAELESARTEQLRASSAALQIRLLRATGMGQDADLLAQAEAASAEVSAFGRALDALAITAEDRAARLVRLEEVQAAERAQIIVRYGEQAAQALRQRTDAATGVVGSLADYARGLRVANDNPLNPTARLDLASSQFDLDLDAARSGDFQALGRIQSSASTLLSVSRDVYGTGQGFAATFGRVLDGIGSVGDLGPDRLTASALAAETRGQTETLVDALARLQGEVAALRREVQQGSANPLAARAA